MNKITFLDKYELISSTDDFKGVFDKTLEKECKFCGKKVSDGVTFNNIPHVLPQLLGKNNYTSNEECDDCNKMFGSFETDLANYISPYQTLIGQKTKNKVPNFQSRKQERQKSTTIVYKNGNPNINFNSNLCDFQYDYKNSLLNIKLRKKKFIPINVFKSLVKIGLSLCPKAELQDFKKTIKWLSKDDSKENIVYDIPLYLFRTRFSKKNRKIHLLFCIKEKLKILDIDMTLNYV